MDLDKIINSNNIAQASSISETKFINLEYLFYQIYLFFHRFFGLNSGSGGSGSGGINGGVSGGASGSGSVSGSGSGLWTDIFTNFLYILILILATILFYCIIRMFEIRKKEDEYLQSKIKEFAEKQKAKEEKIQNAGSPKNPRWLAVTEYINSDNQNDWRLAILEADTILESLVDDLGFKGDTFGEKLKSIDKDKFKNLSSAWEAHNVRNRIAHEGIEFEISNHEAKRIIGIYEQIFRDYAYI
jgi:preprotein translocase subunit SecG